MKVFRFSLYAFLWVLAGLAQARPVVLEEAATLTRPDASWTFFGRFGVAIDGDWALVSGERFVPDPSGGQRHEGAAFLYLRSGAHWDYVSQLGPVQVIPENVSPGLGMKDGVAVTMIDRARVFERSGATWTFTSNIDADPFNLEGPDVEVDNGRVLIPYITCSYSDVLAHKTDTAWTVESFLFGQGSDCLNNPPAAFGDVQGDRAAILNPQDPIGGAPTLRLYRPGSSSGGSWQQFQQIDDLRVPGVFGSEVAMAGPYVAVTGRVTHGTNIAYQQSPFMYVLARTGLQAADAYFEPGAWSGTTLERAGTLFAQRNYSHDRKAYVINLFRVNDDTVHASAHVAQLQTRTGTSVGSWIDSSDNRIIVSGYTRNDGDNVVRVFELPASFDTPAVQVHDFESPSAAAAWQPTAGSAFSVVQAGVSRVYRQTSVAGDAASFLPASAATNQAIQAEVTIRSVDGADRWVGLTTRRSDDSNYYYVTLRTSGRVQIKKMVAGAFTTLASAPATVTIGRRYRLRLESIGTVHRVYLDEVLVLTAHDDALAQGDAGIAMYRASADYDNVIVTPSPLTSIFEDDFSAFQTSLWHQATGDWQPGDGVLHQTFDGNYARAITGAPTADQIVEARVRPTSFTGPDTWVGLVARYYDDNNYLYLSLRDRDVLTLRRRTNGVLTQLAAARLTVAPGFWYDIRMEVVGNQTRVYVNGTLWLWSNADPGPIAPNGTDGIGQVGLITFKATADFDDFRAYQP